jgi:hypothetical protein
MLKFLIGYLIFSALFIAWLCWLAKHTPVSPDDETGDIDYDDVVKDMKIEQDMYLNNKEQEYD